jgi:hypothetical protein
MATMGYSREELESEIASELADRTEMALININAAVPVNAAVAANVLSNQSPATATTGAQTNHIPQTGF